MTWTTHIDTDANCVFTKFFGAFDIGQMRYAADEMFNDPHYRSGMHNLRDIRDQVIPSDISFKSLSDEAKKIMDAFDSRLAKCRLAVVAGDVQSYAKVHQFIVAGRLSDSPVERKPFRDIEKALRWLDIPEGYEINYPTPDEIS